MAQTQTRPHPARSKRDEAAKNQKQNTPANPFLTTEARRQTILAEAQRGYERKNDWSIPNWAMQQRVSGPEKSVLMEMAIRTDRFGYCYPSVRKIAEDTGHVGRDGKPSRRQVFRILRKLEEQGLIGRVAAWIPGKKERTANGYFLPFWRDPDAVLEGTGGYDADDTTVMTRLSSRGVANVPTVVSLASQRTGQGTSQTNDPSNRPSFLSRTATGEKKAIKGSRAQEAQATPTAAASAEEATAENAEQKTHDEPANGGYDVPVTTSLCPAPTPAERDRLNRKLPHLLTTAADAKTLDRLGFEFERGRLIARPAWYAPTTEAAA